jgi:hypothetical protein
MRRHLFIGDNGKYDTGNFSIHLPIKKCTYFWQGENFFRPSVRLSKAFDGVWRHFLSVSASSGAHICMQPCSGVHEIPQKWHSLGIMKF